MNSTQILAICITGLKILLGVAAVATAVAQVVGLPSIVAEFDAIGIGQWLRYATAALLSVGAVMLIAPATAGRGAAILCAVCLGAFVAQLFVLHGDVVHRIVPAIASGVVAWRGHDLTRSARQTKLGV